MIILFNCKWHRGSRLQRDFMSEPWVAPGRISVLIEKDIMLITSISESLVAPVKWCLIGCGLGERPKVFLLGPCQACKWAEPAGREVEPPCVWTHVMILTNIKIWPIQQVSLGRQRGERRWDRAREEREVGWQSGASKAPTYVTALERQGGGRVKSPRGERIGD